MKKTLKYKNRKRKTQKGGSLVRGLKPRSRFGFGPGSVRSNRSIKSTRSGPGSVRSNRSGFGSVRSNRSGSVRSTGTGFGSMRSNRTGSVRSTGSGFGSMRSNRTGSVRSTGSGFGTVKKNMPFYNVGDGSNSEYATLNPKPKITDLDPKSLYNIKIYNQYAKNTKQFTNNEIKAIPKNEKKYFYLVKNFGKFSMQYPDYFGESSEGNFINKPLPKETSYDVAKFLLTKYLFQSKDEKKTPDIENFFQNNMHYLEYIISDFKQKRI